MRKVALALALAIALPSMVIAAEAPDVDHKSPPPHEQGKPGDHEGHRDHGQGKFEKDLDLTKDQSKAARKEFREGMRERFEITKKYLDKLPKADQEAMQAELKQAEQKHLDGFLKLLTPEQKIKAEAFHKEHQERKGHDEDKVKLAK